MTIERYFEHKFTVPYLNIRSLGDTLNFSNFKSIMSISSINQRVDEMNRKVTKIYDELFR